MFDSLDDLRGEEGALSSCDDVGGVGVFVDISTT